MRYLVQNSLGRMWVEGHEADPEKLNWQYYLPEAEQEPEVAEKLARIREEFKSKKIEDIKFLDKTIAYLIQANGHMKPAKPYDIRGFAGFLHYGARQ